MLDTLVRRFGLTIWSLDSVRSNIHTSPMTRSYDWIGHHARTRPDATAMVDLGTDRTFTWAEMEDRTMRLADALVNELGVSHGDRVAVLANNNSNFFEVQFACWKLGAVFVPLNWRLAIPELEFIVGDCSPKVIIFDDDFVDAADQLAKLCDIEHRISWGENEITDGSVASYEDILSAAVPVASTFLPTQPFTSVGSTWW